MQRLFDEIFRDRRGAAATRYNEIVRSHPVRALVARLRRLARSAARIDAGRPIVLFAVALFAVVTLACGRHGFDRVAADDAPRDAATDAASCELTGQLGHWTMNLDDIDDEIVRDVSGAGRHGRLVGTPRPAIIAGTIGEALDFAATSLAYIALPELPVDSSPGAYTTIALWFYVPDANRDEVLAYLPPGPGPAPPRYDLWLTTAGGPLSLCINTGEGECWGIAEPTMLSARWVHVVAMYFNGATTNSRLYIDGTRVNETCVFDVCDQTRTVQAPFELAGSDATWPYHGKLDDVRIFDRALSDEEVQTIYSCR